MMHGSSGLARWLALASVVVVACRDGEALQSPVAVGAEPIRLDVRVHVLQSGEFAPLNSTLAPVDVDTLFAGVNAVWRQAGIVWRVESVVREPARNVGEYARIFRGQLPPSVQALSSIFPTDHLLPGKWDVFVIRDFGDVAGGIYLQTLGVVLFAELGPDGSQAPDGAGRRILAHELGHSLGLPHVTCTPQGNLMAPGCAFEDRIRLSAEQVAAARKQAARGQPFGL